MKNPLKGAFSSYKVMILYINKISHHFTVGGDLNSRTPTNPENKGAASPSLFFTAHRPTAV